MVRTQAKWLPHNAGGVEAGNRPAPVLLPEKKPRANSLITSSNPLYAKAKGLDPFRTEISSQKITRPLLPMPLPAPSLTSTPAAAAAAAVAAPAPAPARHVSPHYYQTRGGAGGTRVVSQNIQYYPEPSMTPTATTPAAAAAVSIQKPPIRQMQTAASYLTQRHQQGGNNNTLPQHQSRMPSGIVIAHPTPPMSQSIVSMPTTHIPAKPTRRATTGSEPPSYYSGKTSVAAAAATAAPPPLTAPPPPPSAVRLMPSAQTVNKHNLSISGSNLLSSAQAPPSQSSLAMRGSVTGMAAAAAAAAAVAAPKVSSFPVITNNVSGGSSSSNRGMVRPVDGGCSFLRTGGRAVLPNNGALTTPTTTNGTMRMATPNIVMASPNIVMASPNIVMASPPANMINPSPSRNIKIIPRGGVTSVVDKTLRDVGTLLSQMSEQERHQRLAEEQLEQRQLRLQIQQRELLEKLRIQKQAEEDLSHQQELLIQRQVDQQRQQQQVTEELLQKQQAVDEMLRKQRQQLQLADNQLRQKQQQTNELIILQQQRQAVAADQLRQQQDLLQQQRQAALIAQQQMAAAATAAAEEELGVQNSLRSNEHLPALLSRMPPEWSVSPSGYTPPASSTTFPLSLTTTRTQQTTFPNEQQHQALKQVDTTIAPLTTTTGVLPNNKNTSSSKTDLPVAVPPHLSQFASSIRPVRPVITNDEQQPTTYYSLASQLTGGAATATGIDEGASQRSGATTKTVLAPSRLSAQSLVSTANRPLLQAAALEIKDAQKQVAAATAAAAAQGMTPSSSSIVKISTKQPQERTDDNSYPTRFSLETGKVEAETATAAAAAGFSTVSPPSVVSQWTIPNVKLSLDGRRTTLHDALESRKGLIFCFPGAFAPLCTNTHLPGIRDSMHILKKAVDLCACVAVNDPYVLKAWAKELKMQSDVIMIADWEAKLTRALGLELEATLYHMGTRSRRAAILVDRGAVLWFGLDEDAFADKVAIVLSHLGWISDEEREEIRFICESKHQVENQGEEPAVENRDQELKKEAMAASATTTSAQTHHEAIKEESIETALSGENTADEGHQANAQQQKVTASLMVAEEEEDEEEEEEEEYEEDSSVELGHIESSSNVHTEEYVERNNAVAVENDEEDEEDEEEVEDDDDEDDDEDEDEDDDDDDEDDDDEDEEDDDDDEDDDEDDDDEDEDDDDEEEYDDDEATTE